jgi:hypothetical protein
VLLASSLPQPQNPPEIQPWFVARIVVVIFSEILRETGRSTATSLENSLGIPKTQHSTSTNAIRTVLASGVPELRETKYQFRDNSECLLSFAFGTCRMGDTAAFSMDTGLLKSHADFGINAPLQNRVLFRRVATCAPIVVAPFAEIRNYSIVGPILYVNAEPFLGQNWTFSYILRSQLDGSVTRRGKESFLLSCSY